MKNDNQDALRCAEYLKGIVCEYPQMSEDEPGGYASEADQEMGCAAAHIRRLVAENEAKDSLLRQAVEALECLSEHGHRCNRCDSEVDEGGKLAAAIRQHLGQKGETG